MTENTQIKIFEEKKVRTLWDKEKEEWYFSVVDVVAVLTDSDRPRKYWNDLKKKLQQEGSELSEKIGQLKMPASDGKMYKTDCMNTEQLFRLIQSIPSPKAEPFKLWMAQVAKDRLDELEQKTGKAIVSPLNARDGIGLGTDTKGSVLLDNEEKNK